MSETVRWSMPLTKSGTREPTPVWPLNWPIPEIGHGVTLSNQKTLKVTAVDWFPHGEGDPDDEPFVYIVLRQYKIGDH